MKNGLFTLLSAKKTKCSGLVYRADVSFTTTKRGFGKFIRLNKMKRLSCPGCPNCEYLEESLSEFSEDYSVLGIDKVEDGKLYVLSSTNISLDWETGWVDDFDLCLEEYNTEENE